MTSCDRINKTTYVSKKKKNHWYVWIIFVVAVLITVLAVLHIWNPSSQKLRAYEIVQAKYPEQEPLADKWWTYHVERDDYANEYKESICNFENNVVPKLFAGVKDENRICSPLNVYMFLSMMTEITDGESRTQILKLLDCDSLESVRSRANAIWNINYWNRKQTKKLLANSLWLDQNIPFVQTTMDTLAETYYASSFHGTMGSGGYDKAMQIWSDKNADGSLKMKKQTAGLKFDPQSMMNLVSATCFQGIWGWSYEFKKSETSRDVFHAPNGDKSVKFMHKTIQDVLLWGDNFSAVSQIVGNYNTKMWFILPNEDTNVEDLFADKEAMEFLTGDKTTWNKRNPAIINLSIPKFDIVSICDLTESLQDMGITNIFDADAADFSPMITDVGGKTRPYLSKVKQIAEVNIDEEGCGFTFYPYVWLPKKNDLEGKTNFVLNRPFIFAIVGGDESLLLTGVVNQL